MPTVMPVLGLPVIMYTIIDDLIEKPIFNNIVGNGDYSDETG